MSEREITGYTVAYDRDEASFPVYVAGILGAVLIAGGLVRPSGVLLALGLAATAFAYYNFPLLETGRPRLGANQYGIFIDGFGIVRWRAIDRLDLVPIAMRALTLNELQIELKMPLASALIADWRKPPLYRAAMRLPWRMGPGSVVRVRLDPLEFPPDEVHRTLLRMWRYYRS